MMSLAQHYNPRMLRRVMLTQLRLGKVTRRTPHACLRPGTLHGAAIAAHTCKRMDNMHPDTLAQFLVPLPGYQTYERLSKGHTVCMLSAAKGSNRVQSSGHACRHTQRLAC